MVNQVANPPIDPGLIPNPRIHAHRLHDEQNYCVRKIVALVSSVGLGVIYFLYNFYVQKEKLEHTPIPLTNCNTINHSDGYFTKTCSIDDTPIQEFVYEVCYRGVIKAALIAAVNNLFHLILMMTCPRREAQH